ncbi:MAG: endonuclease III [Paludibacteraceae bacterium]|nr:endonuclease III [Paludibacteraceae bacterium]
MTRKERFVQISAALEQAFPNAEYELDFQTPYQLMVAITLAARCTDKLVNQITPTLFNRYPTPQALAQAATQDLLQLLSDVTYPESKANYLIEAAQILSEKFDGEVPQNEAELSALPGIGRKSANAILAHAFHIPAIPVDTHVARVSQRLKLVSTSTPEGIEKELCLLIPRERWICEANRLTLLGRRVCTFNAPQCNGCPVQSICQTPMEENRQLSLF